MIIRQLFHKIFMLLTGNGHRVLLFACTIDLDKYHKAVEGSCDITYNPEFQNDEKLKQMIFEMTDYLRNNYDMDSLVRQGDLRWILEILIHQKLAIQVTQLA